MSKSPKTVSFTLHLYNLTFVKERAAEESIETVETLLEKVFELDNAILTINRNEESKVRVVCRHMALLMVSMLRCQGHSARLRGGYCADGFSKITAETQEFGDHWVAELETKSGWIIIDAQVDDRQRIAFGISKNYNNVNLGPDLFLKAPEAWEKIQNGLSPKGFGIPGAKGLGIVVGNYCRDIAVRMKHEVNPWTSWNRYLEFLEGSNETGRSILPSKKQELENLFELAKSDSNIPFVWEKLGFTFKAATFDLYFEDAF